MDRNLTTKESMMHKMMVLAKAKPGQVEALAKWYDETHMNDLLAVPGLVTAERHTVMAVKRPDGTPEWDFMLIYELKGDNPMVVLKNMGEANVTLSGLMESTQTLSLVCISQGLRREA
jgi:hypothetical protein